MRILLFSVFTICVHAPFASAQTCKLDDRYLSIQVQRKEATSDFAFELVYVLCKHGQPLKVQHLSNKAPYDIRITGGVAYFAIRGVSGQGKISFKYKTSYEEKESMQYLSANELVAVSWMPLGTTGAPGTFWTSHKPKGSPPWSELAVISAMNQTP